MGKRRLAYMVNKHREGQYVLLEVEAGPATVQEVERRLHVNEPVIKYQSVRIDQELKRAAKLQQARAKHSARRKPKPSGSPEQAAASPA